MSTIYGLLGIGDRDTTVDSVGQAAVFNAINQITQRQEEETNLASQIFVEEETTNYLERYYLPSGGMMQKSGRLTRPGAVKPVNSWDVNYDLLDYRDQVAWDDVSYAYMSVGKLDAVVSGVTIRHQNTVRYEILRHLLNGTNDTFVDEIRGSLTIRRLANADGTVYPAVLGTSTDLTGHSHYAGTNYVSSAISDTNNPYNTIKDNLLEHFGQGNVVVFINNAERAKTEALTAFVPRTRMNVTPGANITTLNDQGLPNIPGEIIGSINDVLVSEWRWIPAGYMFGLDISQPGPLKRRVDIPASLRGFRLVAKQTEFPIDESFWRDRFGFGVGNRLNGVALQLVASTSYTTPTLYL
jgi:hypothetical protein